MPEDRDPVFTRWMDRICYIGAALLGAGFLGGIVVGLWRLVLA